MENEGNWKLATLSDLINAIEAGLVTHQFVFLFICKLGMITPCPETSRSGESQNSEDEREHQRKNVERV